MHWIRKGTPERQWQVHVWTRATSEQEIVLYGPSLEALRAGIRQRLREISPREVSNLPFEDERARRQARWVRLALVPEKRDLMTAADSFNLSESPIHAKKRHVPRRRETRDSEWLPSSWRHEVEAFPSASAARSEDHVVEVAPSDEVEAFPSASATRGEDKTDVRPQSASADISMDRKQQRASQTSPPQRAQERWCVESLSPSGQTEHFLFEHFEQAIEAFIEEGLLVEKGPDFRDVCVHSELEAHMLTRTIHFEDDERVINDYLRRGWRFLGEKGKIAPYRATPNGGLITVILIHFEEGAR